LGTTFTVLNSSGLAASRLGVVLTSAAMMDDVVGLVMVQVISNLGGDDFSWVTVVRPVLVSIAFAVVAPLVCLYIARPLTFSLNRCRENHLSAGFDNFMRKSSTAFAIHTLILLGLITGATYAGTSNLFAAYIAGASISWWDSEVPHVAMERTTQREEKREQTASATLTSAAEQSPSERPDNNVQAAHSLSESANGASSNLSPKVDEEERNVTSGSFIYEHYYHPAVSKILQPLFFASVGFSIPITKMFKGSIVWRGIVYTVLMAIGKLVCGLWLVRFSASTRISKGKFGRLLSKLRLTSVPHLWGRSGQKTTTSQGGTPVTAQTASTQASPQSNSDRRNSPNPAKPFSLHPPLILALAMCARGEIGFLISGVAESNGVFSGTGEQSNGPSDIFLVVTWAIVLCTIIGPLGVGLSVRRVKKLQKRKNRQQEGTGRDVLGVWGVD
jgi:hypothetical protein